MIPYGRQWIDDADVAAVVAALRSDFITQGPAVGRFEAAVAAASGGRVEAVATNSATSSLHLACLALGLGSGGLLWTSPNSFVASSNAALLCGAEVSFVDVDPATFNMSPAALEEKLQAAERVGRLPDVVMPVHFAGEPCDMAAIARLAARYGFRVIEDASHAIGAEYGGAPVGACAHSDICVFSFHPVKIVTTAEGGVATTRDLELAERMRRLRTHGVTRDPLAMEGEVDGPWSYQQVELGLNYRMTDLQAALGASQMSRLAEFVERRHERAALYDVALAGLPLRTQARAAGSRSALHLYPVRLDRPELRRGVFERMRAAGVGVNVHYIPIHTQPHYRRLGFAPGQYPAAEAYYAGALSLPLFPQLAPGDQRLVVDALVRALRDAA